MDFWATVLGSAIGAAVGVVAGAFIQYLVQIWIERRNRKLVLADLRKEAQYNLGIANEMLAEVGRFRAAAQPETFATYQWYFRCKDMLGIALNRITLSGQLYRIFNEREITEIQQLRQFFDPPFETNFIAGRISQLRDNKDISEAHNFANFLDGEIRKRIATLASIGQKR
jgi:hypothetical protein